MTKVNKTLFRICFVSITLCFLYVPNLRCQWSVLLSYESTCLNMNIDHMPQRIRDIPIHKEDIWVSKYQIAPIQREEYAVENWMQKIGVGCAYESLKYIIQAHIFAMISGEQDLAERNYTNDIGGTARGTGAALTFCKFKMGGFFNNEDGEIYTTAEIALRRKFSEYVNLGASISYANALVFNGWDRWDSQEKKETFVLGHIFPTTIFLEGRYESISFYTGATFFPCIYRDMGKDAGLRTNDIGFSCGISVKIPKK